jgi:type II restriction/modification system DNA methylase subunit YeeA
MYIVKYNLGRNFCLYAWDSVTKKVVFDKCFDNFVPAIAKCVSAMKDFVNSLLKNADFFAAIAIIIILAFVLTAALTSLAAVAVA